MADLPRYFISPPGYLRTCTKCGHRACPCCRDWCDRIIGDDHDTCCDMDCTYESPEDPGVEAFFDKIEAVDPPGSLGIGKFHHYGEGPAGEIIVAVSREAVSEALRTLRGTKET